MDLKGKHVIYSGGFGGIGRASVKELLKSGAKYVTIFDLYENKEAMIEFKRSYPGAEIDFIAVDVTKKESITAAFKTAVDKMGHFDILVNGCGIIKDTEIELTFEINLLGLIHSTFAALPYMDKSSGGRGGTIVNISSIAGLKASSIFPIYSVAKHGVTTFTRCMAGEMFYERFGVSFITICPGFTDTNLINNLASLVIFNFAKEKANALAKVKQQSAEVCAKNMIKVIENGKNGGVYILDVGNIKEITVPNMHEHTF